MGTAVILCVESGSIIISMEQIKGDDNLKKIKILAIAGSLRKESLNRQLALKYNHFFPGVLKNLIDWLSRPVSDEEPQVLDGKPAAISGVSLGMSGTGIAQDHLVTLISFLNMDVMNVPRVTIPNAMQQLDSQGKLSLTGESYFYLKLQADAFIDFVRRRVKE